MLIQDFKIIIIIIGFGLVGKVCFYQNSRYSSGSVITIVNFVYYGYFVP